MRSPVGLCAHRQDVGGALDVDLALARDRQPMAVGAVSPACRIDPRRRLAQPAQRRLTARSAA